MVRNDAMKKDKATMGIIDSKSIKNADTAEEKGYDAGKKVSGIKLHIAVDTIGLPHAIYISCANVTDRDGAVQMIKCHLDDLSEVEKFLVDGGYTGKNFANAVKELCSAEVEVVKRNELHQFVVLPKRWIVERSFGWLEKYRRLWKNCERKLSVSLQMTVLAFVSLTYQEILNRLSSIESNIQKSSSITSASARVFSKFQRVRESRTLSPNPRPKKRMKLKRSLI